MADKKYSVDDILRIFSKLEKKIDHLQCFVKECCAKIPVNIGTGIGLFKKLNQNKWEFKSLLPGSNITITQTNNEVVISATAEPISCEDIKDCIGISPSGDANKYLNEQGDWQTITNPNLQEVVNVGNGISNFGGVGNASIQSTNFTNNRALYLNDNLYPTIRLVDNLNASNYLQIDIDTLNLDGVSYNWSSIVNPPTSPLVALPFTTDHITANNNQYVIGDVVWYLGNVYRCLANNDSILPTSTLYWVNLGAGYPLIQQPVDWNSTSGNNQILNKPTIGGSIGFEQNFLLMGA
jgi:hypothetical protein